MKVDPSKAFDECDDFLITVIESFIVAGVMELFGMQSLDDIPQHSSIPEDCWLMPSSQRRDVLSFVTDSFLKRFVNFSFNGSILCHQDKVVEYELQLIRVGLFYTEYRDCIKEGDGLRLLRCWKYLLPFFNTRRTNYAKEALNLLCQHKYLLTERQSVQLLQSRFFNTQGVKGRNIAADLHMEHLNKACKECVRDLGPNKTTAAIEQPATSIGTIDAVITHFNSEVGVGSNRGTHKRPSNTNDIKAICNDLQKYKVLQEQSSRMSHPSFKDPKNLFHVDKNKLMLYMKEKIPDR